MLVMNYIEVEKYDEKKFKEISLKLLSRSVRNDLQKNLTSLKNKCKKILLDLSFQDQLSEEERRELYFLASKQIEVINNIESFFSIIEKLYPMLELNDFDRFLVWLNGVLDLENTFSFLSKKILKLNFLKLVMQNQSLLNKEELDFIQFLGKTLKQYFSSKKENFDFELEEVITIMFYYYNSLDEEQKNLEEKFFLYTKPI